MVEEDHNWKSYLARTIPGATALSPASQTFHIFNNGTGEAIVAIILNTLSDAYKQNPQHIYRDLEPYVDLAAKYDERRTEFDLDPADIRSKTIHLAIPEFTYPKQWLYLFRAIIYGKENGIAVVITRIRE
jgi:hypothetical protein